MKIISWNCNGALRKKFHLLSIYNADVCVIQECEDPRQSKDKQFITWAVNYLWIGNNKNKGMGVFAKENIDLKEIKLNLGGLESFLPCTINGQTLIGVWTKQANSPTFGYIGQMWKFIQNHRSILMNEDATIIGDFNSNTCWDIWDRWWNHSDVVNELESMSSFSLYHHLKQEKQGAEKTPTFYMHRKFEKPYHIDYAFVKRKYLNTATFDIGHPDDWLQYSDHMPLIINF